METMKLKSGYSRPHYSGERLYRRMTVYEAKKLQPGTEVPILSLRTGDVVNVRISGKPKTWKTRKGDVRVPCKYGMYENGYIEAYGGGEGDPVTLALVECGDDFEERRAEFMES